MRAPDLIAAGRRVVASAFVVCALSACGSDGMTSAQLPSPPPPLTTVDVPFCAAVAPTWVAFQDGAGVWTRALPTIVGQQVHFRYAFSSDHGAIAAVRLAPYSSLTALQIQYGKPAELAVLADTTSLDCGPLATRSLRGTVAGIDSNDIVDVTAGSGASALVAPVQPTFSLRGLVPGPHDILAKLLARVNDSNQLIRVILRRTPDLPDSALLAPLDFNSAEAFSPVLVHATLAGEALDGAILASGLQTALSQHLVAVFPEPATGNRRTLAALPAERLRDGDLQIATASITVTADGRRSASVYFRAPNDQMLNIGAPGATPVLSTIARTPSLRLRATFDNQADYDRLTTITFQQGNTTVSVAMTSGYATVAHSGYDLIVPDFSGVAGFDAQWALQASDDVFWTAMRIGGSLQLGLHAQPFDGATTRSAARFGNFTP